MKTYKLNLPIGELFKFLNLDNIDYNVFKKADRLVKIMSPDGFVSIRHFVKKQGYVRTYNTYHSQITCDENHLIKQSDNTYKFISDSDEVLIHGTPDMILNVSSRDFRDVYDISLDAPHEYITANGIICHNTAMAKLIVHNSDCEYIYINASDENNVDNVRNKIKRFVSTVSFAPMKIVILDESDFLTMQSQAALRNLMETFSLTARFILTCNYVDKIIPAIQSRCTSYTIIPPSKRDVAVRMYGILEAEEVKFDPADLALIVKDKYPDIRSIIKTLQECVVDGELEVNTQQVHALNWQLQVIDILKEVSIKRNGKNAFNEIRQVLANSSTRDYSKLYRLLFDELDNYASGHKGIVIQLVAEGLYRDGMVVDSEINAMAHISMIIEELLT